MNGQRVRGGLKYSAFINTKNFLSIGDNFGVIIGSDCEVLLFGIWEFFEGVELFALSKPDTDLDDELSRDELVGLSGLEGNKLYF